MPPGPKVTFLGFGNPNPHGLNSGLLDSFPRHPRQPTKEATLSPPPTAYEFERVADSSVSQHGPVTIQSLPYELLEEIIDLTIGHSGQVNLPPSFSGVIDVWSLSHLSSRFRFVVLSSPRLWTNVVATLSGNTFGLRNSIKAILQRAQSLHFTLRIIWQLNGSTAPVAMSLNRDIQFLCKPFSGRLSTLSLLLRDALNYNIISPYFQLLPETFFSGLTEFHLELETRDTGSLTEIDPILDRRLFSKRAGINCPILTIHARITRKKGYIGRLLGLNHDLIRPLPISLSRSDTSGIAHLSLTGTALIYSPSQTYSILMNVPQLESFAGWISLESGRFGLSYLDPIPRLQHMPLLNFGQMKRVELTICGEEESAMTDCLGRSLFIFTGNTPALNHLSISRYHPFDAEIDVTLHPLEYPRLPLNVRHSRGGFDIFLEQSKGLATLDLCGWAPVKDIDDIHLMTAGIGIFT